MDLMSLVGTILGVASVVGGQLLEGGHLGQILQGTAALIVLGGTLGAMFLSFPPQDIRKAFQMLPVIYQNVDMNVQPVIDEIVKTATLARKEGVLAVEGQRESLTNETI